MAQCVPNPVPQPWASAQTPCLLQGRPQHRAPSGPELPGWSRVPGWPLPWSTRPPPGPVRKLQGQELSHSRLARWSAYLLRCPAQLPQLPPGMGGTKEEPKSQALLPAATYSPLLSRVPGSKVLGPPLGILLVSLWMGLLGYPRGALEFYGAQGAEEGSWGLQALGWLEQGVVWPLSLIVVRGRRPWLAGRLQSGLGRQEPEWSRPTRHGVTWCAQPPRCTPAAAAAVTSPPARCLLWGRPPP